MLFHVLSGLASGAVVGFALGLVGGGGSLLAVPLLVHLVGVSSPHVAIGTSAVAVAANAVTNLAAHVRHGEVKWRCAALFAACGVAGAFAGSTLGKATDGRHLLALFGLLMVGVGLLMLRPRRDDGTPDVRLTVKSAPVLAPRLVGLGFATGAASGFFGIGGGFLIVPALLLATDMPLGAAIGSSLVAVAAFGLTTAANYATSGLVDWPLAGLILIGGVAGGWLGTLVSARLATRRRSLALLFAVFIVSTGIYVAVRGLFGE